MIDIKTFLGVKVLFLSDIYVYPPTLNDTLDIKDYNLWVQYLTLSQEDIWDSIVKKEGKELGTKVENALTPFETLLVGCYESESLLKRMEEGIEFFTHKKVKILPNEKIILFTEGLEKVNPSKLIINQIKAINKDNYFFFQNLIRQVCGKDKVEPPNPNENPVVARIKAKGRERERIKQKHGNKSATPFVLILVAICCMGIGFTPLNIGEIPFAAIDPLFKLCRNKEEYMISIMMATGGLGNSKIKPKYWIREN